MKRRLTDFSRPLVGLLLGSAIVLTAMPAQAQYGRRYRGNYMMRRMYQQRMRAYQKYVQELAKRGLTPQDVAIQKYYNSLSTSEKRAFNLKLKREQRIQKMRAARQQRYQQHKNFRKQHGSEAGAPALGGGPAAGGFPQGGFGGIAAPSANGVDKKGAGKPGAGGGLGQGLGGGLGGLDAGLGAFGAKPEGKPAQKKNPLLGKPDAKKPDAKKPDAEGDEAKEAKPATEEKAAKDDPKQE